MKQEITQLVETKYGFDRCEKTEFVRQMVKEFAKYEKKLAKIDNYEKMLVDGKELSKEVLELVNKKQSFLSHIKVLRSVTDIYVNTSSKHTQAVLEAMNDKIKAEVEDKVQEFRKEELKKVGDFFVIAEMLREKDHIAPTPLTKVPKEKQEAILTAYTRLTRLSRSRDTTMREEAERLQGDLAGLLEDGAMGEYVAGVMKSEMAEARFRISEGPEYEFVMLQPADRLEMSEQVKMDASSQLPKANGLLNRVKESLARPENKIEESKQEMVKPEELFLERSERQTQEGPAYGNQSETPSLVNASQETEFEIAISRSTRRELNRRMRETDKEAAEDEDERERKFLNYRKA